MAKQKVKKFAAGGMGMMKPNFNPANVNPQTANTLNSIANSLQNKGGNSFIPNIKRETPLPTPNPALSAIRTNRINAGPRRVMKKGGLVGSASKRADGIVTKGKTKGKII